MATLPASETLKDSTGAGVKEAGRADRDGPDFSREEDDAPWAHPTSFGFLAATSGPPTWRRNHLGAGHATGRSAGATRGLPSRRIKPRPRALRERVLSPGSEYRSRDLGLSRAAQTSMDGPAVLKSSRTGGRARDLVSVSNIKRMGRKRLYSSSRAVE